MDCYKVAVAAHVRSNPHNMKLALMWGLMLLLGVRHRCCIFVCCGTTADDHVLRVAPG